MELKPTDLFLALMQFLEILVPGAVLAFASKEYALAHIFTAHGPFPRIENEAQGWVAF